MRFTLLSLAVALTIWYVYTGATIFAASGQNQGSSGDLENQAGGMAALTEVERYIDQDYGFSMAIPSGWKRIVSSDALDVAVGDGALMVIEPGYAVGFESPRGHLSDRFADYILIEVLPGDEFGLFESGDEDRRWLNVAGQPVAYDRLFINSGMDDNIDVDLVIFQRGVQALGYTLAFYAIGEPANEKTLYDAFRIMLLTFEQISEPFVII